MKTRDLSRFFSEGGISNALSLQYYSADVEASWTIDIEGPDSLQVVYERKNLPPHYDPLKGEVVDSANERFWLFLAPHDAAIIGKVLSAYALANGEKA